MLISTPVNSSTILVSLNLNHWAPQLMPSNWARSQFQSRRIKSCWSSSKRNSVAAKWDLRSNSWTTTEKYWDSTWNQATTGSSGTTSWLMIPSKSERPTSPMMAETASQSTSRDKSCQIVSQWINLAKTSSATDTSPATKLRWAKT